VGFDGEGTVTWSKVIPEARVTDVFAGARTPDGKAVFLVGVPGASADQPAALGETVLAADGSSVVARELEDSAGWFAAGILASEAGTSALIYAPTETGMAWRELGVATQGD